MEEVHSSLTAIQNQLTKAAEGLLYPSESDEPFQFVAWPGQGQRLPSPAELLRLLGRPAGTPVELMSLEEFFRPLIEEREWFGEEERRAIRRFQNLWRLFEELFEETKIYRVGEVEIDVFVLGRSAKGDLAGLETLSVET